MTWVSTRLGGVCLVLVLAALLAAGAAPADEGEGDPDLPGWAEWVAPVVEAEDAAGLAFFPARFAAGRAVAVRDPAPFTVRMVNLDRPRDDRVIPAGVAAPPPPGRWRYWLESDWQIGPGSTIAVFPRSRGEWAVMAKYLPVEPGGRVRRPEASAGLVLWAVHAELPGPDGPFGHLARRQSVAEMGDGMLMPPGRTLATLWNPADESHEAVSRPFEVVPGRYVTAPLLVPAEGQAFLIVEVIHPLRWRGQSRASFLDGLEVTARQGGAKLPPEEWLQTEEASFALWYGLEPGAVRVSGGGEADYFPAAEMVLSDGEIGHLDESLIPRPLLDVNLILPPEVRAGELSLAVFRTEGGEMLAEAEVGPRQSRHRFRLVHDEVTVELRTELGPFRRVVDLTEVTETSVLLEPEVIRLTGEVRRGGEPAEARIQLRTTDGHQAGAETDEDGGFEALVLRPVVWGSLFVAGKDDAEPWTETWTPPLSEDRHLEIDITDAGVTVRVIDPSTGLPIPEAGDREPAPGKDGA